MINLDMRVLPALDVLTDAGVVLYQERRRDYVLFRDWVVNGSEDAPPFTMTIQERKPVVMLTKAGVPAGERWLTIDQANVVERSMFDHLMQWGSRAKNVPWPSYFYMETGKDRRDMHKEDPKRHAIDWFRPGSRVPLPHLGDWKDHNNPYQYPSRHGFTDGALGSVAWYTFDELRNRRAATFTDIVNEAIRRAALGHKSMNNPYRQDVQDVLRDLALFGIARRLKSESGFTSKIIYEYVPDGNPDYPV